MSERFRHEDISSVPAGWKVRTVTTSGGHRVRVAFPPGRRKTGAGRLVSILHPLTGSNPCGNPCSVRSSNPQELIVMGANPPRRRMSNPPAMPSNPWYSEKIEQGKNRAVIWASSEGGPFHAHAYHEHQDLGPIGPRSSRWKGYSLQHARKLAQQWIDKQLGENPQSGHNSQRRVFWDDSIKKYTAHKFLSKYGNLVASGKSKAEAIRNLNSAVARAKSGQHNPNPQELLIMGANPRVEVVHGENPPVEDIHEEFTGQEVKWRDIYNEPHMPAGRYAELGPLIALYVKPVKGGQVQRIGAPEAVEHGYPEYWNDKPPIVVTDSTARKIYFVDGCQDMTAILEHFGAERREGTYQWVLGQVRRIDYECLKEHVAHPDEDLWKHNHGEEDGQLPTLVFDQSAKRLLYEGGNYRIEGPWIRN